MNYLEEIKKKELKYIKKVDTIDNIFGDNLAEVSCYDFSLANINEESRIEAVTLVAAACYANPNAVGRQTLFNRLEQESLGLPSSSFEFIPILLNAEQTAHVIDMYTLHNQFSATALTPNILYFGGFIGEYLLTNYRAVCADYEIIKEAGSGLDIRQIFNTEEQCYTIKEHFSVFLSYIDTNTRAQYIRHRRAAWQEMSRRYVSGKKVGFDFYLSEDLKDTYSFFDVDNDGVTQHITVNTKNIFDMCVNHYNTAVSAGVAPQNARRVIPQAMYTLVWSGFTNGSLKNFFDLRLDSHAQWEIRKLAEAKLKLIEGDKNDSE